MVCGNGAGDAMTPITVTATARVAAHRAFARLTTPRHIADHLNGVLPTVYAHLDTPSGRAAPARAGRWSFHAEPHKRRIHWQLIDPIHLAGVLDVRGADGRTRLSLTVQQVPQCWPRDRIRALARTVLVQLRDRLAAKLPHSMSQPAHLTTDGSAMQKRAMPARSRAATICAADAKQAPVDPTHGT